jgi:hypothetical protein
MLRPAIASAVVALAAVGLRAQSALALDEPRVPEQLAA